MPRTGENIYKRKDGRWEGRYIKGYSNRKIMYGYVYAKTYKDVKEKLYNIYGSLKEDEKEFILMEKPQTDICFKQIAIAWIKVLKPQLKESSIVKYTNILATYLFPYFGNSIIETVTREDIINFSNELLYFGGRKGNGLSRNTVNSILSVLKSVFVYAEQHEKLDVADISRFSFKQPQKPIHVLTIAEQKKLSSYLCSNLTLVNLGILVCLYTGLRIGEICALKWGDISFDGQYLYVNKTMQRLQNKSNTGQKTSIFISEPKSECSVRRIPIPNEIFRFIVKSRCPANTYFLTGHIDTFIEPRTMQNRFKSVIKDCNIKEINFHTLRHTFATRCVELGFDVKSLSEILGHANVNITMNRYVHPSMELKQKNMNMLSDLFAVR